MNASRYQLAGPVVLGFLAAVCTLEQLFPAQRRPLLARGHLLDFCYAVFYALLVIPLIVLISPAYHRIHHSATGRLDINLGRRPRLGRTMLTQLAEPFVSIRTDSR